MSSYLEEFSSDEIYNLLKIIKEIEKASPVDIDVKKGEIKVAEHERSSN
jgi:hypothetical protein